MGSVDVANGHYHTRYVRNLSADLQVFKTGNACPSTVGDDVTYNVTVSIDGPDNGLVMGMTPNARQ